TVDSTAPTLSVPGPAALVRGGDALVIPYSAEDAHFGAAPMAFEVSYDAGATWTAVAGCADNTGSCSYTPPDADKIGASYRATATDAVGWKTSSPPVTFSVDATPPVLSGGAMLLNDGAPKSVSNIVRVQLAASDTVS